MPARERLPARRLQLTEVLDFAGNGWLLGVGFDLEGRPKEVFLNGPKIGSEVEAALSDGCVLISMMLQQGQAPAELAGHLAREGVEPGAPYASPFGEICARLEKIAASAGQAVRESYAASGAVPPA